MSSKVSCPGSSTMTSDGKACEVKLDQLLVGQDAILEMVLLYNRHQHLMLAEEVLQLEQEKQNYSQNVLIF